MEIVNLGKSFAEKYPEVAKSGILQKTVMYLNDVHIVVEKILVALQCQSRA
jgi:hypothetical protein